MSCCGSNTNSTRTSVQEYYGKILQNSSDLQTNACTSTGKPPKEICAALSKLHEEVTNRYYGCGLTIPRDNLEGLKILDLGCGAGQDCYIISQLVGENGEVYGVDMTDEQIEIANKYIDYHMKEFGYSKSNVKFLKGYIECLDKLELPSNYFDIIISNCVINLSPDKEAVFREAFRVLKPGGELYFSDVYSDRRIPIDLQKDQVLFGECLSGAMYYNDFIRTVNKVGFIDPRLFSSSKITIQNQSIEEKIGYISFYSAVYRLWKLENLETLCEDYGQAIRYKGTIPNSPFSYDLDNHHNFEKGKMSLVCGNTFSMLHETRLASHFDFFTTDPLVHHGIFPGCGNSVPFDSSSSASSCC